MTKTTLRWIGAAILLFNLWLCGAYNITGVPLLLMTVGFAVAFELVVVKPAKASRGQAASDDQR